MASLKDELIAMDACSEAVAWIGDRTLPEAWAECKQPRWMFWWLGRCGVERQKLVLAACACARLALAHARGPEALLAIEAAEGWARGAIDIKKVHAAADAAADAGNAAAAAAAAAYAAAYAADAANAAANANAANAAADAANANAKRVAIRLKHLDQMIDDCLSI